MFAYNERNYGVQSTYKANLEGYTIQLNPDRNSEEYRYVQVFVHTVLILSRINLCSSLKLSKKELV